jgi:SAM-dependent methyltransferase
MAQMPFPDARFDGLMAITSLMYAGSRTPEVLAEIRRVTRPGATVLFVDPGDEINRLIARLRGGRSQTPTGGSGFTREEYTAQFAAAGFEVMDQGGNSATSALLLVPGLAKMEGPMARRCLEAMSRRDCRSGGYAAHALHRWVTVRRR